MDFLQKSVEKWLIFLKGQKIYRSTDKSVTLAALKIMRVCILPKKLTVPRGKERA